MSSPVFSDSWFRVANARVALLSTVKVHRQTFRGKPWYILQETYTQRFFRITPEAYAFISQLTPDKTVEEIWLDFVARRPEDAPGQDEVVRVLSQLHVSNMLYFHEAADNQAIYQRSQKQRQREFRGKLMSFLYVRIFLFDPDPWLEKCGALIRWLTSPLAFVIWALVVMRGGAIAIEHSGALFDHTQGFFSISNLPWLYVALTLLKVLHEAGHAFVCKRFGGEVRAFGVMFLILTPLPYVDVGTTWAFRNRFQRALVGGAGMMVELFMAAIGAMVWSSTSPGVVNSIAFNVMIIGSVSSLVFNGNPLLRFDAYYILADLVDIPNLYQKAQQQWLYFGDRYLLGTKTAESPATDRREWMWFTVYGISAFCYRMMTTTGIVLFVLSQWFVVGLVMAAITLFTLIVMPVMKLYAHLNGPRVQRNRVRAVTASVLLAAGVIGIGGFLPLPYGIRSHGVLQAHQSAILHAVAEGTITRVAAANGAMLRKGDVIVQMTNPELDYEYELARQEYREAEQFLRQSIVRTPADILPVERRMVALATQMRELEFLRSQLTVRASEAGEWVAPALHERQGTWASRGQPLGELVRGDRFRFVAVVPQEQADELFGHQHDGAKLRLSGQSEITIPISNFVLIPYQRDRLSSSALGWAGGGEIAVKPGDQSGEVTAESFYELHALLPRELPESLRPMHGLSGIMRIPLPEKPLFWQLRKELMQLFQKRFQL